MDSVCTRANYQPWIVSLTNQSCPVAYATSGYQEINKRAEYNQTSQKSGVDTSAEAGSDDQGTDYEDQENNGSSVDASFEAGSDDQGTDYEDQETNASSVDTSAVAASDDQGTDFEDQDANNSNDDFDTKTGAKVNFGRKPAPSREGFRAAFRKAPTVIRDEIFRLQKTNKAWRGKFYGLQEESNKLKSTLYHHQENLLDLQGAQNRSKIQCKDLSNSNTELHQIALRLQKSLHEQSLHIQAQKEDFERSRLKFKEIIQEYERLRLETTELPQDKRKTEPPDNAHNKESIHVKPAPVKSQAKLLKSSESNQGKHRAMHANPRVHQESAKSLIASACDECDDRRARERQNGLPHKESPRRQLYIGNISFNATAEDVHAAIESALHLRVDTVTMPLDNDRHRGYAFVTIAWPLELDAKGVDISTISEALSQLDIKGRTIYVEEPNKSHADCNESPPPGNKGKHITMHASPSDQQGFAMSQVQSAVQACILRQTTALKNGTPVENSPRRQLYIGNVSFNATEDDVAKAIKGALHLTVDNVTMPRGDGRHRGYAFVTIAWPPELHAKGVDIGTISAALSDLDIKGRPIYVKEAHNCET